MTTASSAGPVIELGMRHRLASSHRLDVFDVFIDGEAGVATQMEAFAGLRFGYQLAAHAGRSAQRGFDFDLGLRAIAIDHDAARGIGGMFVMTMAWDD